MDIQSVWAWASSNLEWSLLVSLITALIPSVTIPLAVRKGFGLLQDARQAIWCSIAVFLSIFALMVGNDRVIRPTPELSGKLSEILIPTATVAGNASVLFRATISNSGTMQTAVKNWSASVDFGDDVRGGRVEPIPSSMLAPMVKPYFPLFSGNFSLVEESRSPITPGSVEEGFLLLTFPNVRQDLFVEREPVFTVQFEDVMGRKAVLHFKANPSSRRPFLPPQLATPPAQSNPPMATGPQNPTSGH